MKNKLYLSAAYFWPILTSKEWKKHWSPGAILEAEGSIWKVQKWALFYYKTVKKGTPTLTFPYVYGLFTIFLRKQIFEKNK